MILEKCFCNLNGVYFHTFVELDKWISDFLSPDSNNKEWVWEHLADYHMTNAPHDDYPNIKVFINEN